MRISFDLDDTLICYQPEVPREPRLAWYQRVFAGDEPLRRGSRLLMGRLRERGWEICVYTTSCRRPALVRRWLRCHGIRVANVINQDVYEAHLKRVPHYRPPTKNPKAFGIDLHVDDLEGVRLEGETHGFRVLVVRPDDEAWADKVWTTAEEFREHRMRASQDRF